LKENEDNYRKDKLNNLIEHHDELAGWYDSKKDMKKSVNKFPFSDSNTYFKILFQILIHLLKIIIDLF
jgi:hypothetical protein